MSKVLVIEPYNVLKQALVIALFPEYQLEFVARIPANLRPGEFTGVIVDAVALEEVAGPGAATIQAVLDWQLPTLLIERSDYAKASERPGLVRLKLPIGKEILRASLARCLTTGKGLSTEGLATESGRFKSSAAKVNAKKKKPKNSAVVVLEETSDLIELVDVIEEPE